jgi:hypothetical protein
MALETQPTELLLAAFVHISTTGSNVPQDVSLASLQISKLRRNKPTNEQQEKKS